MHDPMTMAFSLVNPFRWTYKPHPKYRSGEHKPWCEMTHQEREGCDPLWPLGYREPIGYIWHVDPERDGTDDSCGWFRPKLTAKQKARLFNLAWSEARDPHFFRIKDKRRHIGEAGSFADIETEARTMILLVARTIGVRVSVDEATRWACEWFLESHDALGQSLCFQHGYHDNVRQYEHEESEQFAERKRESRQRYVARRYENIAELILRERRPWWRHPRWHVWHWRIQINAVLCFKRWAFSRCSACGGRFAWGESPVTNNWNSLGPRWFRSEPDVAHARCGVGGKVPRSDDWNGIQHDIASETTRTTEPIGYTTMTNDEAMKNVEASDIIDLSIATHTIYPITKASGIMETPPKPSTNEA